MRYTELTAFQKHIHSSGDQHLAKIYLLISEETYDIQLVMKTFIPLVLPKPELQEMALVRLNLSMNQPKALLNELRSLNLFSSRRLIIAQQLDALSTEQQKTLLPDIQLIPKGVTLVLVSASLKSNTTFYKTIEKSGVILDLSQQQKPWERERSMQEWAVHKALEMGKKITPSTAKLLVSQLGCQRALLASELSKLACFVGEREEIQPGDITQVCDVVNLESVWQLCDAIFLRQTAKALSILNHLLVDQVSFFLLLRQIRSQFHVKCHIAALIDEGQNREAISNAYGYMKGSILEQTLSMISHYGLNALQEGLILIDQAELKAKNQADDQQLLAEMLIVKLTG